MVLLNAKGFIAEISASEVPNDARLDVRESQTDTCMLCLNHYVVCGNLDMSGTRS